LAIFFLLLCKKFLPISFQNSAFGIFFLKTEGTKKRLQRLKQEWQKSPDGSRKTYSKNYVWFGEIERKLAKLSKTTFTYPPSFIIL
jgi:hypothetical protein